MVVGWGGLGTFGFRDSIAGAAASLLAFMALSVPRLVFLVGNPPPPPSHRAAVKSSYTKSLSLNY